MSLILDALNRSRQDAHPVPGLDTQHRMEPLNIERRQYLWWALLALCGVVIVWLVVDRLRTPSTPAEDIGAPVAQLSQNLNSAVSSVTTQLKARAAAVQAQQPDAAPAVAPANTQSAVATEPALATPTATPLPAAQQQAAASQQTAPVSAAENQSAALPPTSAPAQAGVVARARPAAVQPAEAMPTGDAGAAREVAKTGSSATPSSKPHAQNDEVSQLYQHPELLEEPSKASSATRSRSKPASADAEQPVDIEKMMHLAQEELKNAKLEEHSVPFLTDLSQKTKDEIPTIYYQKHDFSSDPAVSSVTLNGTSAKVGGTPVPGLKVEEILRDSVVLSYHGTQFRLRALNSWVNL